MSRGVDLSVVEVSKSFGSKQVLQDLNLEIKPGEFVAIVGRSGCGKSTLLRLVSGLDRPTQGGILVYGEPITQLNDVSGCSPFVLEASVAKCRVGPTGELETQGTTGIRSGRVS